MIWAVNSTDLEEYENWERALHIKRKLEERNLIVRNYKPRKTVQIRNFCLVM